MLVILFLLPFAVFPPVPAEPLPTAQPIVNGTEAFVYDYPFVVYLAFKGTNELICGGSIFNRWNVLTAAHCIDGQDPMEIIAVAGYNKERRHMQVAEAMRFVVHPKFLDSTKDNSTGAVKHVDYDYGIVKLRKAFQFTLAIKPVVLATEMDLSIGDDLWIMGWGTTKPKMLRRVGHQGKQGGYPPLNGIFLKMNNFYECKKNYSTVNIIVTDRFFCASAAHGDTCSGDSGSPLVVKNVQYGINSYAAGCFRPGFPSVFASVPEVIDWIMVSKGTLQFPVDFLIYFAVFFILWIVE